MNSIGIIKLTCCFNCFSGQFRIRKQTNNIMITEHFHKRFYKNYICFDLK